MYLASYICTMSFTVYSRHYYEHKVHLHMPIHVCIAGADPGEGHRGQMTPPSETSGKPKNDVFV